jgi:hypothetical protein
MESCGAGADMAERPDRPGAPPVLWTPPSTASTPLPLRLRRRFPGCRRDSRANN